MGLQTVAAEPSREGAAMSEGTWYIDPDAGAVSADDEETYDEAYGPGDPKPHDGRIVEDDEGVRSDTTSEAVGHVAVGDTAWKSAEEAAVHVVSEFELIEEELVDMDELPEKAEDR
jgi:hypothetical protein